MSLGVVYLLVFAPAIALIAGLAAVLSTRRSAERVREVERRRVVG